jgi:hypothetical protein
LITLDSRFHGNDEKGAFSTFYELIKDRKGKMMSAILPEGEPIRKAVKWISEQRENNPDIKLYDVICKAGLIFNLSPKDEEFLFRFCKEEKI